MRADSPEFLLRKENLGKPTPNLLGACPGTDRQATSRRAQIGQGALQLANENGFGARTLNNFGGDVDKLLVAAGIRSSHLAQQIQVPNAQVDPRAEWPVRTVEQCGHMALCAPTWRAHGAWNQAASRRALVSRAAQQAPPRCRRCGTSG